MGDIGLLSAQTVGELIHQKFESPLPKTQEGEDPLINGKSDQVRGATYLALYYITLVQKQDKNAKVFNMFQINWSKPCRFPKNNFFRTSLKKM